MSYCPFYPNFDLHINLCKCELHKRDSSFPDFPPAIKCVHPDKSGLELLGSPVWGTPQFFTTFLSTRLDKISNIQDKLADLEDPQVELHLFRVFSKLCTFSAVYHLPP